MATFSFAPQAQADMVSGLTRGRGELTRTEEGWTWTVSVRNLNAAASFCMEHAMDGMRPVAPDADRKSTRLNSSHSRRSRMPSSA